MAQRALVRADGFITDIVEAGEEFEIYTGPGASMKWMDIPDDATNLWKLELGEWIPDYVNHDPFTLRVVAYGDPGVQLSYLWKDIDAGLFGDAAKESKFYLHCKQVKEERPEVPYDENGNPVNPNEPFPHDEVMPAWLSAEQMSDDVQEEFKIGKFAVKEQEPDA